MLKLLLLSCSLYGLFTTPPYRITGRLVDHQYNPVGYFIIETYASNKEREPLALLGRDTVRNSNGEFKIQVVKKGSYLLRIAVPNYTDYSLFTTIQDSSYSFPEIHLQPTK
ncbi:hypothetical protein [Sphingobacterium sp. 18053]|uniref:hypothetical protein n=1 Tax=Sphingobacterium sp. 18053 TaxID=2681401 RepID=UPI001357012C|nr:hypothetical protein [Sphingobacterium sp. 18053]